MHQFRNNQDEHSSSLFRLTRQLYQNESSYWPSDLETYDMEGLEQSGSVQRNGNSESTLNQFGIRPPEIYNLPDDQRNPILDSNNPIQPINKQVPYEHPINKRFLQLYKTTSRQVFRHSPIRHPKMRLEQVLKEDITKRKMGYARHNMIRMNYALAPSTYDNNENIVPKNLLDQQANHYRYKYEDPYSLTPLDAKSPYSKFYTKPSFRKISKDPFKILDAPKLLDDFYLNLVDWSCNDLLAVGLGSTVYLLSACSSKTTKLFDVLDKSDHQLSHDAISCVNWDSNGSTLAVGLKFGIVELWDVVKNKKLCILKGHQLRVGSIAWNGSLISSGSKDGKIFNFDLRQANRTLPLWNKHCQEVCGLRWSPNERQLASGGNDNVINIWQMGYEKPVLQIKEHLAAVKALSWSPHQNGLLASGGGTADRTIRFWNTLSNQALSKIDTDSQVCNIAWSKTANELVSTHGYSLNQIIVWSYPPMTRIAALTGHTCRVLYLAESPHGQNIVTGAGDETLRFWNIFPSKQPVIISGKQEMRFQTAAVIR